MSGTGNVFMDAFLKAGISMSGDGFTEWESVDDYKFPFGDPKRAIKVEAIRIGWVKLYNEIRRKAKDVDAKWIDDCNAVRTDEFLRTWMRNNSKLLKVVNMDSINELYKIQHSSWMSETSSYEKLPLDFRSGFELYIEYNVTGSEFVVRDNFNSTRRIYGSLASGTSISKILNWVTQNTSRVEFIPIIVNRSFEVTHRSYKRGKITISEVKVPYLGSGILRNEEAMVRLSRWIEEGNTINPSNEYYILASKGDYSNLYLRRKREGDEL